MLSPTFYLGSIMGSLFCTSFVIDYTLFHLFICLYGRENWMVGSTSDGKFRVDGEGKYEREREREREKGAGLGKFDGE